MKERSYQTLLVRQSKGQTTVAFNRLEKRNSINALFLQELNRVFDEIEEDRSRPLVLFEGREGIFCTGMDFDEALSSPIEASDSSPYMATLKRMEEMGKVFISKVDGLVMAGGVGIVAASDFAVVTPKSRFSLSEALWGLLPAMVLPYLVRKIGYQKAYLMTLSTLPFTGEEIYSWGLADALSDNPDEILLKWKRRLVRLDRSTLLTVKRYFGKLGGIEESIRGEAMKEFNRLSRSPRVRENIRTFVENGSFPWEQEK